MRFLLLLVTFILLQCLMNTAQLFIEKLFSKCADQLSMLEHLERYQTYLLIGCAIFKGTSGCVSRSQIHTVLEELIPC